MGTTETRYMISMCGEYVGPVPVAEEVPGSVNYSFDYSTAVCAMANAVAKGQRPFGFEPHGFTPGYQPCAGEVVMAINTDERPETLVAINSMIALTTPNQIKI